LILVILVVAPLVGVGLAVMPDKIAGLGFLNQVTPVSVANLVFDNCSPSHLIQGVTQENCYANEMSKVSQAKGGDFAFQVLFALQKFDTNTVGCHFIAHGIGYGIYRRDPSRWRDEMNKVDSSCSYGAIHGILEQYVLTSLPGGKLEPPLLPTICGDSPRADCNHILGHLTLVFTKGDVAKGLSYCEVFKDYEQQFQCKSGVFMEEQTAVNLIAHGLADKSWSDWSARVPELTNMCREQTTVINVDACWQELTHAALVKFQNDPSTLFDFCDTAQANSAAFKCKQHGIGIISVAGNESLKDLGSMCRLPQVGRDNFTVDCFNTLVASVLVTSHGRVGEAANFCGTLDGVEREQCFGQVGSLARGISSTAGKVCDLVVNSQDKLACEKGPKEVVRVTSD
jgi:hypothetical protein